MRSSLKFGTKTTSIFRHRQGFIRDGKRFWITPWRNNLILDSGMNAVSAQSWATSFRIAIWGNQVAPDPVRRDSGAITFTAVGTALTASGNFFVAQDTGRLIKFNDVNGQEFYLTFLTATTATLSAVPGSAIVVETATIWYVNQTAVQSPITSTSSYGTTGGDNGTSFVGNVATLKRTHIGTALGAPTTLTEIGFNNNAVNVNIFDRDIIPGGIALIAGDQPLCVSELIQTFTPDTPQTEGNVGTGCDTSGESQLLSINPAGAGGSGIIIIATNGTNSDPLSDAALEPAGYFLLGVLTTNVAIPAFGATSAATMAPITAGNSAVAGVFSAGTWERDFTTHFNIGTGNGTIYGIGNRTVSACMPWAQKFTTPFTKLNTQTLDVTWTKFWTRTLIN